MNKKFKSLRIEEQDGMFQKNVKMMNLDDLPKGDVLIKVMYSSLNYKDALSSIGNRGVTKNYPHTPGIDAVGLVEQSTDSIFKIGDSVLVTGFDLGMNTWGGLSEYIRVPKDWVLPLPSCLSPIEAMIYGTGGFTAGQSVYQLLQHLKPDDGPIIVSGATGGVGIMSLAILAKLGFETIAITGKSKVPLLHQIGVETVLDRSVFMNPEKRPLLKGLYAGAVDTVGGMVLENIIKSTKMYGAITCCGNIISGDFNPTVYPFILRGVRLIGISSQNLPLNERLEIWEKLGKDWKPEGIMNMFQTISLDEVPKTLDLMIKGLVSGRTIVKI